MVNSGWIRVTRTHPCPVCGKPDWCLLHQSGEVCICPRTPDGCAKDLGEAGYLHKLGNTVEKVALPTGAWRKASDKIPVQSVQTSVDWESLAVGYRMNPTDEQVKAHAASLGVTFESLERLEIGHDGRAWTFPMRDVRDAVVGVRIRADDGRKWAVTGSQNGLFIPRKLRWSGTMHICEGPTDCAALLDLELDAIGRPSCSACVAWTVALCKKLDVVIVADQDPAKVRPDGSEWHPGQDGARKLADALLGVARSVKVIVPGQNKDARQWRQHGATRAVVEAVVRNARYWGKAS